MPVALFAGARPVTVGAVVSPAVVKLQATVANGLPAVSLIAVAPPVSVTVYLVLLARLAVGFRVATRVVALYVTPAPTRVPVAAFVSVNVVPPTPVTASLNVAVTLFAT